VANGDGGVDPRGAPAAGGLEAAPFGCDVPEAGAPALPVAPYAGDPPPYEDDPLAYGDDPPPKDADPPYEGDVPPYDGDPP